MTQRIRLVKTVTSTESVAKVVAAEILDDAAQNIAGTASFWQEWVDDLRERFVTEFYRTVGKNEGAVLDAAHPLPALPAACSGGDVGENAFTYRDMVPVPLNSRGHAHCALRVGGELIRVTAASVRLEMVDVPKYIEHLRRE